MYLRFASVCRHHAATACSSKQQPQQRGVCCELAEACRMQLIQWHGACMGRWWSGVGSNGEGQAPSGGMDNIRRVEGGACGLGAGQGHPGIERTKTASGRLWFQAEEPVPLGKKQSGIAQEVFSGNFIPCSRSPILASIHTNKGRAMSAFADGFHTEAKANMVPIGVHPTRCWLEISKGKAVHAVHFAA
eukprot:1161267-Pelagomonas_calceolata.AAC.7